MRRARRASPSMAPWPKKNSVSLRRWAWPHQGQKRNAASRSPPHCLQLVIPPHQRSDELLCSFGGAAAAEGLGPLAALGVAAPGAEAKRCLEVASALPTARHPASSAVLNHFRRQGKT